MYDIDIRQFNEAKSFYNKHKSIIDQFKDDLKLYSFETHFIE